MGNAFCPPLLPNEDEVAFWAVAGGICEPYVRDPVALLLAWDVAVLTWQIQRVRRAAAAWIWQMQVFLLQDALARAMVNRDGCSDRADRRAKRLVDRWRRQEEGASEDVERLLREVGIDFDCLHGQAIVQEMDELERLEAQVSQLENRRNATLRTIARWSAPAAVDIRRRSDSITDNRAQLII
jgi:hypothetical protein